MTRLRSIIWHTVTKPTPVFLTVLLAVFFGSASAAVTHTIYANLVGNVTGNLTGNVTGNLTSGSTSITATSATVNGNISAGGASQNGIFYGDALFAHGTDTLYFENGTTGILAQLNNSKQLRADGGILTGSSVYGPTSETVNGISTLQATSDTTVPLIVNGNSATQTADIADLCVFSGSTNCVKLDHAGNFYLGTTSASAPYLCTTSANAVTSSGCGPFMNKSGTVQGGHIVVFSQGVTLNSCATGAACTFSAGQTVTFSANASFTAGNSYSCSAENSSGGTGNLFVILEPVSGTSATFFVLNFSGGTVSGNATFVATCGGN